ncbi:pca operon transcription factor PcaQ [Pelagibacterium halotolerans]|uniref:Pca operon transcriptional activator PcaQ n=1 Tax=Pelagibacterium halotolerans (strain DSM 22347 / JCM 15775 / CGMCC 1.7692 / B2) TaxID=1082931 RepID=G4R6L4_PELHB|nr:pca operon transcription factor PcaQ [Pelagibacterium halotolerans]AEQ51210.1 Pca operon transcriptional activator PcaQ [Pelagibacterium halotolerans B2]QJR18927.1 pca operon transcription factor PcaQ [Pelagibacterium halotolerans]SEA68249.1 LysR family transcriptional regulator, pca operon transcriptional activator [Pelagibacterium halotolerans]
MENIRIRFRHLRTLIEVSRQGSIVKAADVLGVTQPAVTKTIRELEDIVGKKLFDREGRGVRITRYGEVFLKHAGASVAAIQLGIDSLARTDAAPPLKIGALPTVASRIIPLALTKFLAERTGSSIKIVTGETKPLVDQLRNADLDIVIGRLSPANQMMGLRFEYLYSEQVRFVVRTNHPLIQADRFTFTAIRDYPILMPPEGSVIRPYVDDFLLAHGMAELPHAIESVSASFGKAFTEESDAVWVISDGVVSKAVEAGRFSLLPVDTSDTMGPVGLTCRGPAPTSPSVEIFIKILHSVVQDYIRLGKLSTKP